MYSAFAYICVVEANYSMAEYTRANYNNGECLMGNVRLSRDSDGE